MPDLEDYYQKLGVSPEATLEEIRRAYRVKARDYHPDRLAGVPDPVRRLAEEKLKEVNAAYEVLGDSEKRRGYDAKRLYRNSPPRATPTTSPRREYSTPYSRPEMPSSRSRMRGLVLWAIVGVVISSLIVIAPRLSTSIAPVSSAPDESPLATAISSLIELPALDCSQESSSWHRESFTSTSIEFVNSTTQALQIYGLSHDGGRQSYIALEPSESYVQSTFVARPWEVADVNGQCLAVYLPVEEPARAVLDSELVATSSISVAPRPVGIFQPTRTLAPTPTVAPLPTPTFAPFPSLAPTPTLPSIPIEHEHLGFSYNPWEEVNSFEGCYETPCFKSGETMSVMQLLLYQSSDLRYQKHKLDGDRLSFYVKLSSGQLEFRMRGNVVNVWAGPLPWTHIEYDLPSVKPYAIEWDYSGDGRAWVDNVKLYEGLGK